MAKTAANYTWQGFTIPERMAGGLQRWIEHGVLPGDFLTAVLENDLRRAIERADDENMRNLPAYPAYLYNEAPTGCWGSPAKVAAWQERFTMGVPNGAEPDTGADHAQN